MPALTEPTDVGCRSAPSHMKPVPRICLMGLGAKLGPLYLSAISACPEVLEHLVVVDPDVSRARDSAAPWGVHNVLASADGLLEDVDGVIVAGPPHLHFDLALKAIRAGCHVLCEEPLSTTQGEAIALVHEASMAKVAVAVNSPWRLYPSSIQVRQLLGQRALGVLRSIHWVEETSPECSRGSGSHHGLPGGARGVLSDLGPRAVDLLCWWMGGRPHVVSYLEDRPGGSESAAQLMLAFGDVTAVVRLSRRSTFQNRYRIEGALATLEGDPSDPIRVRLTDRSGCVRVLQGPGADRPIGRISSMIVDNFLAVAGGHALPLVPAAEVIPSISILQEAYARRERSCMSWMERTGHGN